MEYWMLLIPFALGWWLDYRLGDPNVSWHPIIFYGRLISFGERRLNQDRLRALWGGLYNGSLILLSFLAPFLPLYLAFGLEGGVARTAVWIVMTLVSALMIFFMLSGTTLIREVRDVFRAVDHSLQDGRKQVARIVGRDTQSLSEQEVRTAALETLSENLSDGVVAPMMWWMLLGLPGMMMYKMINTQDSMIGYRNERYRLYGCFSARVDDMANYLPARLTALLMLVVSGRLDLIRFVLRYGPQHASPNSGYPEAALAGILNCRFGGSHDYFGETIYKPFIGEYERPLTSLDMATAIRINRRVELATGVIAILGHTLLLYLIMSLHPFAS